MTRQIWGWGFVTAMGLSISACGSDAGVDGGDAGGGPGGASGTGGGTAGEGAAGSGGAGEDGPTVAGTELYDCSAPSGDIPALALVPVASGFNAPVLSTYAPGDASRMFVVEQEGLITVLTRTGDTFTAQEPVFLDIVSKVTRGGSEQGLLGLAFHPDYQTNGLFYVHYSAANGLANADEGDTIVEEYQVSADANVADSASARRVLRLDQPAAKNHNGGTLTFGPDQLLFLSLGDGGDDSNTAQDVTNWFGSILRIDPTGESDGDYTTPTDNLASVLPSAAPELWSYGFRNPYRMNFDGCTGDLYVGDVGDGTWEEVDLIPLGTEHQNYGWPIMEGMTCRGGGDNCDKTGYTLPVATFDTGGSSIVGGSVYRGSAITALRGTYIYGETGGAKRVYTFRYDGKTVSDAVERTDDINPSGDNGRLTIYSIQNGADGEVYFTATSGEVLRLVAE